MVSIGIAIIAVAAALLFGAVTALADALGRRDELNFLVSPPSERRGGGSVAGPLSPGSSSLSITPRGRS